MADLPSELEPKNQGEVELIQEAQRRAYARAGGLAPPSRLAKIPYFQKVYRFYRSEAERGEFAHYYQQSQQSYAYVPSGSDQAVLVKDGQVIPLGEPEFEPEPTPKPFGQMSKYEQLQELKRLEKEEPEQAYKPGFWEQTPTRRHIKGEVTQMGEAAEHYFSLGGRLDYQPSTTSPFLPTIPTGDKGTTIYRQPTLSEMTPEQRFETTVSEVKPFLLQELKEEEFKQRVSKAEFQYGKEMMIATLPSTAAKGVGFGVLSALAPPLATAVAGIGFAGTGMRWEETKETFIKYPKESAYQVGAGLLGVGFGAVGTAWAVPKIKGMFRTIGGKKVDPFTVMEQRIITKEKTFPTAPEKYHLKLFKESPYKLPGETRLGVWKAAPSPWGKQTAVLKGGYELPGGYVAPSISPHFLRAGTGEYVFFGLGMESVLGKSPTALRIYPKGILRGSAKMISRGKAKWLQPVEKGYAYIPGIKPEVEGIIPAGTQLQRIKSPYYTIWGGTRVPIHQYEIIGAGGKAISGKTTTFGKLSSYYSYGYGKPTPFISPTSLVYGVSRVSKPKSSMVQQPLKFMGYSRELMTKPYSKISLYKTSFYPQTYKRKKDYYGVSKPYGKSYPRYDIPTGKTPYYYYGLERKGTPTRILFPTDGGFGWERKTKRKTPGRPFMYQPSLAAMGLGLKSFKIPELAWTGIVTRPRIRRKRRKRRK